MHFNAFEHLPLPHFFDSKFLYDTCSIQWNTLTTNNATASFWTSSILLSASGSNSSVIRQSRRRFNYQSGKSLLGIFTGNFVSQDVNTIKRIGHFDQNNGTYFVYSGSQFGVGYRNNGVDTFISQSAWNLDVFNGSGPSGNSINITASQIYFLDLEWLGVGRVRWGIFQSGIPTYVHQLTNVNTLPYTSPVYKAVPNNPVRYELINSGSSISSLVQICSTVITEGGYQLTGPIYSIDNGSIPSITGSASAYYGLVGIRLKTGSLFETITPTHFSFLATPSNTAGATVATPPYFKWSLLLNPSTGSNPVWIDNPNSCVQIATASAFPITNEGTKIASGYAIGYQYDTQLPYDESLALGATIQGIPDVLVLAISPISVGTAGNNIWASLGWQESI